MHDVSSQHSLCLAHHTSFCNACKEAKPTTNHTHTRLGVVSFSPT